MIKKAVIAGLIIALMIQKLKHIEEIKNKVPTIPVAEIDDLLRYFDGLSVTDRIAFKMLLYKKGIIDENRWFIFGRYTSIPFEVLDYLAADPKRRKIY